MLKPPDGRRTIIPVYRNETLLFGTVESIMDEVEMSAQDFVTLLRGKKR